MKLDHGKIIKHLRANTSSNAATWVLNSFPLTDVERYAIVPLLSKRTWARRDLLRLADHFMTDSVHATPKIYKLFYSIMSAKDFIANLKSKKIEVNKIPLLIYQLEIVIHSVRKHENETTLMHQYLEELRSGNKP